MQAYSFSHSSITDRAGSPCHVVSRHEHKYKTQKNTIFFILLYIRFYFPDQLVIIGCSTLGKKKTMFFFCLL